MNQVSSLVKNLWPRAQLAAWYTTITMQRFHWYVQWLIAGAITGFSLLLSFGWLLVVIGLLIQYRLIASETIVRRVFLGALLSGTTHMLISLSWSWSTVQLTYLGLSNFTQATLIAFFWSTGSLVIGLGYALALALYVYIKEDIWWWRWSFPLAILLGELLGRLFFSFYTVGEDGGLNVGFGFGHFGFALASHPVLVIGGKLFGVYGLSLLSGMLVLLWVIFVKRRSCQIAVIVVMFGLSFISPKLHLPDELASVALLSTHLPLQTEEPLRQEVFSRAIREAEEAGLSTIILTEDSRYFSSGGDSRPMTIVDTTRVDDQEGKTIQQADTYDPVTNQRYHHGKLSLVPLGEYVPLFHKLFLNSVGLAEAVKISEEMYGYLPGDPLQAETYPSNLPPVLFCYESSVPYAVRLLKSKGDWPYIAHVVSHAWFADGLNTMKYQLAQMLSVQAVWNNTYILQSGNEAPVAIYGPLGQQRVYNVPDEVYYQVVPASVLAQ